MGVYLANNRMSKTKFIKLKIIAVVALCLFVLPTEGANEATRIIDKAKQEETAGKVNEAIITYSRLNDIARSGRFYPQTCEGLDYAGNLCSQAGRYIEALEFYTLGIEQASKAKDSESFEACTIGVGTVYGLFNDYERAIFYFKKAYQSALENRHVQMAGVATTNLVTAYCRVNNAAKAKEALRLQMKYPLKDRAEFQYRTLFNQGQIALLDKNAAAARYYFNIALEVVNAHNLDPFHLADAYKELGRTYTMQNERDSALTYYNKAVVIIRKNHYYDQAADIFKTISELYKQMGKADSAAKYQAEYIAINDSLFNQQHFNVAKDDLFKYENRVNDEQIFSLKDKINKQFYIIVTVLITLVVLGAFLLVIYRYNRKLKSAYKLLISKNRELNRQKDESHQLMKTYLDNEKAQLKDEKTHVSEEDNADDTEKHARLINDISEIMEQTEVISDPEFNMGKLAKLVNSNTSYVSAAINDTFHKNFKSFLNEYRIREACKQLTDDEHYGNLTISAIAEAVGFKSPTSFITAFKRVMGMTPSVYKRLSAEEKDNTTADLTN